MHDQVRGDSARGNCSWKPSVSISPTLICIKHPNASRGITKTTERVESMRSYSHRYKPCLGTAWLASRLSSIFQFVSTSTGMLPR